MNVQYKQFLYGPESDVSPYSRHACTICRHHILVLITMLLRDGIYVEAETKEALTRP